MNVLVFSTQRLASYLSSRVLSSIFLPYTPPWAAGPEKAADWPSRIDLLVTPGVCAMVLSGTTQTISETTKNLIFMTNPPWVPLGSLGGRYCLLRQASLAAPDHKALTLPG